MKKAIWRILFASAIAILIYSLSSGDKDRDRRKAELEKRLKVNNAITTVRPAAKATAKPAAARAASAPQPTAVKKAAPTNKPGPTARTYPRTDRNWRSLMTFPTDTEIDSYNRVATLRSPYLSAWIKTNGKKFVEYTVEFKADFVPNGTYCCLANFDLDYSQLKKTYKSYRTEYRGVAGYAGLQKLENGQLKAIMSFWDVFCTDKKGKQTTIRANLVYPANQVGGSFGGEGTGAHYLADYQWQPGRWYRMRLQCMKYAAGGNTVIEQWVQDMSTEKWTKLCAYDLGVKNVSFKGDVAVFLENFIPAYAGEIRTMECRNFQIKDTSGKTRRLTQAVANSSDGAYRGSYRFGAEGKTLYMITTGVTGKGKAQRQTTLKLK